MTQEEILEGNKLIAQFMGSKLKGESLLSINKILQQDELWLPLHGITTFSRLKYHSSWDWLFPVLEKIWSITGSRNLFYFNLEELAPDLKIPWFYNPKHTIENQFSSTIEEVYSLIVSFIEYYNEKFKS